MAPEKKLLGIIASHRKLGNCEIAVKAVADKIGKDWELSLVRLTDLRIAPCKGCYACLLPGGACRIDDDVEWLLARIADSHAVVLAAPDYVLGPVGIVKMLADRSLQAAPHQERYKRIPVAALLTLGREEYRGYADTALAAQVSALGLQVAALECLYGTHPGEVALDASFDQKIASTARSLLDPPGSPEQRPGRCPRCRSDLFRVKGDGLECALCKAGAVLENGRLRITGFHPEFSDEGRSAHLEWLVGKKEQYARIRDDLKKVQDGYRGGNWVRPGATASYG
jgi:multimeric flavodoxin WrbA